MQKSNSGTMIRDLTTGSVTKQLITFATPLFLSGLLQTLYNMVDMVVVGQFVGSAGLSAVSVGGEITGFLMFIAMGVSNAGQIIISQFIGADRKDDVRKLIGTLFTFLMACSVALTIVCLTLLPQIMQWAQVPVEALGYAKQYVGVCVAGLVFIYGYNLVSAILRGMGDSRHPFMFVAIASVVNLLLDLLFIAVFNMGPIGAALATVIGQAVSFIWAIIFLYRSRDAFGFDFKLSSFRLDPGMLATLMKLGVPMILQSASISFSHLFITSWVNSYGVVASAVTGIGGKLSSVTNVFANALSTAGGSMVAQNIGAEKYDRVPRILATSLVIDSIIVAIVCVITAMFPKFVFGLFTGDAAVLEMATIYIPVALLQFGSCALRPPMSSLINGSGNARLILVVALLDGIILRIGLSLIMGTVCGFGIHGFWYGNAISSFTPFFVSGVYFLSGRWRTTRHILNK